MQKCKKLYRGLDMRILTGPVKIYAQNYLQAPAE